MKNAYVNIKAQRPQAVWVLSDLHLGHTAFDKELFEAHRELARAARARILFLGDALEAVTTGSKVAGLGGQFDQTLAIGDQEDLFIDYMKGFRVLACVEGNHEARITRTTGTSPFRNICRTIAAQQGKPCPFLQYGGYMNIKVGSQTYSLVIHHGEGGPTTFFRHLMRDFPEADLYAGGHTHQLTREELFVHTRKGTPRRVSTLRTGSYLSFPSYTQSRPTAGGIPATGSWMLWLYPDTKRIRIERMEDRAEKAA